MIPGNSPRKLPQYFLTLGASDKSNEDVRCVVIVALQQKRHQVFTMWSPAERKKHEDKQRALKKSRQFLVDIGFGLCRVRPSSSL